MVVNTGPEQSSVMFSALTSPWDFSRAAAQSALQPDNTASAPAGGGHLSQPLDASRKAQGASAGALEKQKQVR